MPSRVQAAPLRPAQPSNMALWGQFTYGRGAPRGLPGASGGGGCPIGRVPHQGATHAQVRGPSTQHAGDPWPHGCLLLLLLWGMSSSAVEGMDGLLEWGNAPREVLALSFSFLPIFDRCSGHARLERSLPETSRMRRGPGRRCRSAPPAPTCCPPGASLKGATAAPIPGNALPAAAFRCAPLALRRCRTVCAVCSWWRAVALDGSSNLLADLNLNRVPLFCKVKTAVPRGACRNASAVNHANLAHCARTIDACAAPAAHPRVPRLCQAAGLLHRLAAAQERHQVWPLHACCMLGAAGVNRPAASARSAGVLLYCVPTCLPLPAGASPSQPSGGRMTARPRSSEWRLQVGRGLAAAQLPACLHLQPQHVARLCRHPSLPSCLPTMCCRDRCAAAGGAAPGVHRQRASHLRLPLPRRAPARAAA